MALLFLSPLERPVASALLLLFTTPPSPSPLKLNFGAETSKDRKSSEESLSVASIGSKSSSSYLTSHVSSKEVRPHKLSFVAAATGCHELMKLKVTILKQRQIHRDPCPQRHRACLSSNSSAISSAQSKHSSETEKKPTANLKKLRKKRGISSHMRRRDEGILKLPSSGGFSEVTIRRVLGDSPDTSKALEFFFFHTHQSKFV